jgi:nitrogen fixation/metabolism regulation signal transduction histidine kinase
MRRLEWKLVGLLLLVAGVPLLVGFVLAQTLFARSLDVALNPATARALDDAVGIYGEYVRAEKGRQHAEAEALARDPALLSALASRDEPTLRALLARAAGRPRVLSLTLLPADGVTGVAPLQVASPLADQPGWLADRVDVPLPEGGAWETLRFAYGLEAEVMDRFHQMETEVVAPYARARTDRGEQARILTLSFVAVLGTAVVAALVIALVVGRRTTTRLRRLRAAMAEVAAGNLDVRLRPAGHDEIADLARGFNHMADRIVESQARVQYLTQVSAWQGIARRLAHEIKNPLTPILLAVQQIHSRYRGEDAAFRRQLDTAREIVEQEVENLRRLVETFSRFARLPAVVPQPEDLGALARDLVAAHPEIPGLRAEVPDAPVVVPVDRGLLRQALTNLVQNAAQATRAPHVVVAVAGEPGGARIAVRDAGPGVPEADRERIFEPYVTGRADGTGLGLAIVKKIVLDHGGDIRVGDAPEGGASFEIRLPAGPGAVHGPVDGLT